MKAHNISVSLSGRRILEQVDFEARPGEVTAIVGPNGSGKTTLLRAMTAEVPCIGDLWLNGFNVKHMTPWELAAMRAVQSQSTTVAFAFSVVDVVRLGLSAGVSAADTELPSAALARVDLAGFENRLYHDLSGGEQQRVQLARALAQVWDPVLDGKPRWLLLDEPVASLDIGHQFVVMDVLRDFAKAGGGVVAVMHDLNLTAMFADQVALVHQGRIAAAGTPHAVMTNEILSRSYGCSVRVNTTPGGQMPFLLPQARTGGIDA